MCLWDETEESSSGKQMTEGHGLCKHHVWYDDCVIRRRVNDQTDWCIASWEIALARLDAVIGVIRLGKHQLAITERKIYVVSVL